MPYTIYSMESFCVVSWYWGIIITTNSHASSATMMAFRQLPVFNDSDIQMSIWQIINPKKTHQNASCVHNSYDPLYKDIVHLFWLAGQEHNNWYEASIIIINAISCSAMYSFLRTNPNIFPRRPCPNNNRPRHNLTHVDLALRPAQFHVGTHGIDRISD